LTDLIAEIIAHARREDRVYLMEHECKAILRDIGVPTTTWLVAKSEEEAVAMSEAMGYPVALKILSPEIIHKSDAGGVKLKLGREEVRAAYNELVARFKGRHVVGVSVQEMAKPGLEVIVGATRDVTFGPVLMFGLGGVFVEVLKDVAFRVIPTTEGDAQEMMEEIKGLRASPGLPTTLGRHRQPEGHPAEGLRPGDDLPGHQRGRSEPRLRISSGEPGR